jgi:hypothetical protein
MKCGTVKIIFIRNFTKIASYPLAVLWRLVSGFYLIIKREDRKFLYILEYTSSRKICPAGVMVRVRELREKEWRKEFR